MIDELRRELDAAGVRGRWQRRALEEAGDHLAESQDAFGEPRSIARGIAAVVATTQTRRAAFVSFAALAAAGVSYLAAFAIVASAGWSDITTGGAAGMAAAIAVVFAPQIAFVAGMLMASRALRLRSPASAAELGIIRRRAAVALAFAGVSAGSWIVYALAFEESGWIVALSAIAIGALAVAAGLVHSSAGPQALPGEAGDLFDELPPLARFRPHPWRFAAVSAAAVGAVTCLWGWNAEGTLADGLVRGLPEALAVLAAYAALGRVLALRR